jgi:hypothetical protein
MQKGVYQPVGRILLDHLCNVMKPLAYLPSLIDDYFFEVFSTDMMPQRKLSYSP